MMTDQLEYINHLLQILKMITYYVGIMLNAFSHLLRAGIIGWSLYIVMWKIASLQL